MKSLGEKDLEGKEVLLRTDLNLPVEDGEPQKTVRFERYKETIKYLIEEDAKTVIIAHQGRPARKDFLSLEKHSNILSESLEKNVEFIPSFFGPELGEKVARMDKGEVALLQNIRFLSEELQNAPPKIHANDFFIEKASKYFQIYVNDAFSAAHRSHGSLVGFTENLESYPGKIMKKELKSCKKVRDQFDEGVLVLGGEKPSDLLGIIKELGPDANKIILGGIPGELALMTQGYEIGKKEQWIEKHGLDNKKDELKEVISSFEDKIMIPSDVATSKGNHDVENLDQDSDLIWDIGDKTIEKYSEQIENANQILMKGPMGAFEEHPEGTRKIVQSIANSEAYTVLGGGHTSSLVQRFGLEFDQFNHVSIAGGAFVRFLSGEDLPAVEALK